MVAFLEKKATGQWPLQGTSIVEPLWPGSRLLKQAAFRVTRAVWRAKKGGTNGLAVRAGRPVTQTTPSTEGGMLTPLTAGINTP
jgi:hypothetical protein